MEVPSMLQEGMLDVGAGHAVYWRSHGNRAAPAVVVLHGGPGGAMNPQWGEFFDPEKWHVIFFDQRGCGKSTPFGELRNNDLPSLVNDMEQLRTLLGIERWALFGGSWGTTLALAYGAAHPARCLGFLLRGIFLGRQQDLEWFLWDVRQIFPEQHRRLLDAIETATGRRPRNLAEILAYTEAPLARFDEVGLKLARAWSGYEYSLSGITPAAPAASATPPAQAAQSAPATPATPEAPADGAKSAAVSMALLERHYIAEQLPPAVPLLTQVPRIAHLPCYIVHGQLDMVCPAEQADALAQAWPGAHLSLVEAAGHWTFAPGIAAGLRRDALRLEHDLAGG